MKILITSDTWILFSNMYEQKEMTDVCGIGISYNSKCSSRLYFICSVLAFLANSAIFILQVTLKFALDFL